MDDVAREALAQRLSEMDMRKAIREMKKLDPEANMVFWQNSIWDEFHTMFLLPNEGIEVTLVEQRTKSPSDRAIGGGPQDYKAGKQDFTYVGARVAPLSRPAHKRGADRPLASRQLARR